MSPPLDLDAMVCGGAVACGGAFLDGSCQEEEEEEEEEEEREDPYAPAESLRLRIGEDIDWTDVAAGGAAVLQRDDYTKGAGANPKSAARRSVQHQQQATAPRSSVSAPRKVAPAVVIGGLPPAATGKVRCSPCRLGGGRRARVFAAGEQKAVVGSHRHMEEEPGSPKVSCLGAVRAEQRPAAAGRGSGTTSRRTSWRSWFAALLTCCFSSRRCARTGRASKGNEADD